ncbi:MAG: hypothetical protein MK193_14130 [Lentisphaeria bacterium]|nr:hypothetical protein [Lentisphaeria bacterium]
MSRIEPFYDSEDMSICISANTKFGELKEQIAKDHLYFPLAWDENATLLQMLQLSPITSYSMIFGSWADNILGMNIKYKGKKLPLGGRVVKNVTGFDFVRAIAYGGWTVLEPIEMVLRLRPKDTIESLKISGEIDSLKTFCNDLKSSPWGLSIDVLDFYFENKKYAVHVTYHGRDHEREILNKEMHRRAELCKLDATNIDYQFPFKYTDNLTIIHTTISKTMYWCNKLQDALNGSGIIHFGNGTIFWKSESEPSECQLLNWTEELSQEGGFAKTKDFQPPVNEELQKSHNNFIAQLELEP